jgi:hypothetical protein
MNIGNLLAACVIAPVLALCSCASHKMYDGPTRPESEVASVRCPHSSVYISLVDGLDSLGNTEAQIREKVEEKQRVFDGVWNNGGAPHGFKPPLKWGWLQTPSYSTAVGGTFYFLPGRHTFTARMWRNIGDPHNSVGIKGEYLDVTGELVAGRSYEIRKKELTGEVLLITGPVTKIEWKMEVVDVETREVVSSCKSHYTAEQTQLLVEQTKLARERIGR